jgi:hypothetical protein
VTADDSTLEPQPPAAGSGPVEARIAGTAAAATDVLHVKIASWDGGEHLHGPVVWQPRPGPIYPADGDWCLAAQSDRGTWCVLLWDPNL